MPGALQVLWQSAKGGYHMEYGYSCMGYEIAGAMGIKLAEPDEGGDLLRRRRLLHDGQLRARHRGDAARPLHRRADRQPRLRLHQPPAAGVRRRRVQQHVQGQQRRGAARDRLRRPRRLDGRPRREGRATSPTSRRGSSPPAAATSRRSSSSTPRPSPAPAPAATGGTSPSRRSAAPSGSRRPASATTPTPRASASSTESPTHDPLRNQPHRLVERRRLDPRRPPQPRRLPRRLPEDRLRRHREGPQDARRRRRAEGEARRVRPALRRRLALDQPPRQRHRHREDGAPGLDRLHQGGRRRPHQRLRMLEHRPRQRQGRRSTTARS